MDCLVTHSCVFFVAYFCFNQSPWDDSKLVREKDAFNSLDAPGKADILNITLWGGVNVPAGQ